MKITRRAPSICHLFFSYDSFIFCKASNEEARDAKDILDNYSELSVQLVNFSKCTIFLSKGANSKKCYTLAKILGV